MASAALEIAARFRIHGRAVAAQPIGAGYIHESFVVACQAEGGVHRYLLQRLNAKVFPDLRTVMANIQRVIEHITRSLERSSGTDIARRHMTLIAARDGSNLHRAADGAHWRMYELVPGTVARLTVKTIDQAAAIASAYGEFQRLMSDLGPPRLAETIPQFHDTPRRYAALDRAVRTDSTGRVNGARTEIDFARSHRPLADALTRLVTSGAVPERVVHNDAKASNVLLDSTSGKPLCVVDLDTVMPGLVLWDFGDMVRSMVCPAKEDETELSRVQVHLPLFEGLVRGYLREAGSLLNEVERDNLVTAGQVITLEQGVRFLTDYLSGDTYYRVERPQHNLDRCRNQFRLLTLLHEHEDAMRRVVRTALS